MYEHTTSLFSRGFFSRSLLASRKRREYVAIFTALYNLTGYYKDRKDHLGRRLVFENGREEVFGQNGDKVWIDQVGGQCYAERSLCSNVSC